MSWADVLNNRFGFADAKIEAISSGEENSNYSVSLPNSQYILRVYSQEHSTTGQRQQEQIEQEHRFISHLADHGVPTPRPITSRLGNTACHGPNGRFFALFDFVDGSHPANYTPEIATQTGQLLRAIREASQQFDEPPFRTWQGDTVEDYLAAYHSVSAKFSAEQRAILNPLAESVSNFFSPPPKLDRGIIHGDVKLGNLLFTAEETLATVIDFDDFREAFYLEELARTLMHDLHSPSQNAIRAGAMPQMLDGYLLGTGEQASLKPFLQARFLHDVGAYIFNDLSRLVDELLADKNLGQMVLE